MCCIVSLSLPSRLPSLLFVSFIFFFFCISSNPFSLPFSSRLICSLFLLSFSSFYFFSLIFFFPYLKVSSRYFYSVFSISPPVLIFHCPLSSHYLCISCPSITWKKSRFNLPRLAAIKYAQKTKKTRATLYVSIIPSRDRTVYEYHYMTLCVFTSMNIFVLLREGDEDKTRNRSSTELLRGKLCEQGEETGREKGEEEESLICQEPSKCLNVKIHWRILEKWGRDTEF